MELRSKGPGSKGNLPIREKISGPISFFLIGYKGISIYRKNLASLMKFLGAKFHCAKICGVASKFSPVATSLSYVSIMIFLLLFMRQFLLVSVVQISLIALI